MPDIASLILLVHVSLGTVAIAAGAGALLATKGGPLHRRSGTLFALTMGTASLLGAILGLMAPAEYYITFHAGLLGLTLIAGSWLTVRLPGRHRGIAMSIISLINLANLGGLVFAGAQAAGMPDGRWLGFAAEDYLFLAGMTGFAAIGDLTLVFRKTLSDRHRIARHLWRMCLGFFIAAGSAFTGPGAEVFPDMVQRSGLLALPELLIFLALLFWLIRTWWKGAPQAAQPAG